MSDSQSAMLEKLNELEGLLESETGLTEQHRDHLQEVVAELRGRVEEASHPASLGERLSELALSFEASHPTLTRVLQQLSDALGSAGI